MTIACESDILEQAHDDLICSVDDDLGAKNRRLAKKLNKAAFIHGLYGGLDGLSLSYSMVKYSFDLLYTDSSLSSSDMMHNWMVTPEGIAASAVESVFFIAFSLLGNLLKEDDENAFKRYIAILWPYFRDTTKGLKNAYKGVRGGIQAIGMLAGHDLRYMMVPVGVLFGVLSVANRIWYRRMKDERKEMQAKNTDLLLEIQANCRLHLLDKMPENFKKFKNSYIWVGGLLYYVTLDGTIELVTINDNAIFLKELNEINKENKKLLYLSEELTQRLITQNTGHRPSVVDEAMIAEFRERIQRQTDSTRAMGLLSSAYGGLVDGLYLYMGALSLAAVSPPVFVTLLIFSVIYTVTCVAVRMYEEYDYQRKLITTQAKVELALCGKELEILFATLQQLSEQESRKTDTINNEDSAKMQQEAMQALELKMKEFEKKQETLRSLVTLSNQSATLAGLKNGLATYGAIASVMFAVATINAMLLAPFPPVFLVVCVVSGIACLLGFLAHSLITNYLHRSAQEPEETEPCTQLSELLTSLKDKRKEVRDLKPAEVKEAILDGMVVDPSPQFFFQEGAEVARSIASGIAKGQKSVDYTLNPLQESDDQGHYHDSTIMLWITAISSTIYALVLGLRAYARGFSQDPPEELGKKMKRDKATGHGDNDLPQRPNLPDPDDNEAVESQSPKPSESQHKAKNVRSHSHPAHEEPSSFPHKPATITHRHKFFSKSIDQVAQTASNDASASFRPKATKL